MATKELDKMERLKADMQKAKKAWAQSKENMDQLNRENEDLEKRKAQISEKLQEAENTLSNIEGERREAIQLLVVGKITEGQFNEIKKKHEHAKQSREDYAEMLDVADDKLMKRSHERTEINREEAECRNAFWRCVTNILTEEALETPIAIKACIAHMQTSSYLEPEDYFKEKILRRLTEEDRKKIVFELTEQYTK